MAGEDYIWVYNGGLFTNIDLKWKVKNSVCSIVIISLLLAVAVACVNSQAKSNAGDIVKLIPPYVKDSIYMRTDNPFTAAKADLGHYFFYDRRMSVNQTKSCASCHAQAFSFTDGYRRSIGALGDNVQHNAPALINLVFNKYLTAADSTLHFPEQQINNPMFHNKPVELGWKDNESMIMERLKKDSLYSRQLPLIFGDVATAFTVKNIQDCISCFIKTILSFNSPYDRYVFNKDTTALSAAQKRGMLLFFSDKLNCQRCHGGINFSVPALFNDDSSVAYYQNTGLYNTDDKGAYPAADAGLIEFTGQRADMGKFLVPTLRNLAFTAPYLHDGTASSLTDIIDIYAGGGRIIKIGVNRGDGRKNPYKNPLVQGFAITAAEKKDLIDFLLSLSDSSICVDKKYSNPFLKDETR